MEKIEKYVLPEYLNNLFKDEAHTFLSLTVDCANKINELIDAFNMFNNTDEVDKLNQNGKIAGAIRYMKDNLQSSLKELTNTLIDTGYFDAKIEEHCKICDKCNEAVKPETPEDETSTIKSPYLIRKDGGSTLYVYQLCRNGYVRYTLTFELVSEVIHITSIDLCDNEMNVIHTLSSSHRAIDGYIEIVGNQFGGVHGSESGDSGMNYYINIDGKYYSLQGSFNAIPEGDCHNIIIVTDTYIESGGESLANRVKRIHFKSNGCLEIVNQYVPYTNLISKLSGGYVSMPKELVHTYTADDDIFLHSVRTSTKGELLNSMYDTSLLFIANDFILTQSSTALHYKRKGIIYADETHINSEFADMDSDEITIDTPHTISSIIRFDY